MEFKELAQNVRKHISNAETHKAFSELTAYLQTQNGNLTKEILDDVIIIEGLNSKLSNEVIIGTISNEEHLRRTAIINYQIFEFLKIIEHGDYHSSYSSYKEREKWVSAASSNNLKVYKEFINSYPGSNKRDLAQLIIYELEHIKSLNDEEYSLWKNKDWKFQRHPALEEWNIYEIRETAKGYFDYLKNSKLKTFKDTAEQRIFEIEKEYWNRINIDDIALPKEYDLNVYIEIFSKNGIYATKVFDFLKTIYHNQAEKIYLDYLNNNNHIINYSNKERPNVLYFHHKIDEIKSLYKSTIFNLKYIQQTLEIKELIEKTEVAFLEKQKRLKTDRWKYLSEEAWGKDEVLELKSIVNEFKNEKTDSVDEINIHTLMKDSEKRIKFYENIISPVIKIFQIIGQVIGWIIILWFVIIVIGYIMILIIYIFNPDF